MSSNDIESDELNYISGEDELIARKTTREKTITYKDCGPIIKLLEGNSSDAIKQAIVYHMVFETGPRTEYNEDDVYDLIRKYVPHVIDIKPILWGNLGSKILGKSSFPMRYSTQLHQTRIIDYLLEVYPPSTYDTKTFEKYIVVHNNHIGFDSTAIQSWIKLLSESDAKITLETFGLIICDLEPQLEDLDNILQLVDICLSKIDNPDLEKCYKCVCEILWDDDVSVDVYEQLLIPFETRGFVFNAEEFLTDTSKHNFEFVSCTDGNLEFFGSKVGPEAIYKFLIKYLETSADNVDGRYVLDMIKYLASKGVNFADGFAMNNF
jgi:hypothetical protein